jgi:penicillin-binding protein 2
MKAREHHSEIVERVPRLQLFFLAAIVFIAGGYWVVQIVHGASYQEQAINNSLRKRVIKAPRGLIYGRESRPLVENVASYDLWLHPSRSADIAASRAFLEGVVGELSPAMSARWERPRGVTLVAEDLSLAEVAQLEAMSLEHPEFELEVGHLRLYRHGAQAAHLVGYLSEASEARLAAEEDALAAGDLVGVVGIEAAFDEVLRGTRGERRVVVDHRGRVKREHSRLSAQPGQELPLELDLSVQQAVARHLEDSVGAVVVLDPRTGAVLAMVSSPSYDPNVFTRRLASDAWERIVKAPHDPLQNRTLQNTYSPGSVFKIVVATAGLSDGLISPEEEVNCAGATRLYNHQFH